MRTTDHHGFAVNNAGYALGVEHVGEIADADIEGMFAVWLFECSRLKYLCVLTVMTD